jgi:transposase InsO family protein
VATTFGEAVEHLAFGQRVLADSLALRGAVEGRNDLRLAGQLSAALGSPRTLPLHLPAFFLVAFILDVCSMRMVGWSMSNNLRTGLVVEALEKAFRGEDPLRGLFIIRIVEHGTQRSLLASGSKRQVSCRPWVGRDRL